MDASVPKSPRHCSLPEWASAENLSLADLYKKAPEIASPLGVKLPESINKIGKEDPLTYGFPGVTKETNCLLQQLKGKALQSATGIFGKFIKIDTSGEGVLDGEEFSKYVKKKTGGDDPELYEDDIPPLARDLWRFSVLYTLATTEPPKPDAGVATPGTSPEQPLPKVPFPPKDEPPPQMVEPTRLDWRRWVSGHWPTIVIGALVAVGVALVTRRLWILRKPSLPPHPSVPRWTRPKPPPQAHKAEMTEAVPPDASGARVQPAPVPGEGTMPPEETTQRIFEEAVGGRPTDPVRVDVALPPKPPAPRPGTPKPTPQPGTPEEIDFAGLVDESEGFETLRQRLIHGIERLRLEQPPLYNRTHPEAAALHDQLAEMMRKRYGPIGLAEVPPLEVLDELRLLLLVRKIRALEREAPLREIIEKKLAVILERSRQSMGSGVQYELSVTRTQEFLRELALKVKDMERAEPVRLKVEELLEAFHGGA